MRSLNGCALVILVHLWKRISIGMEISRDGIPPNWEVFFKTSSQIRSVRSWLTDEIVECLAWSFPSSSLHTQECSDSKSWWESKHPAVSGAFNDWAHEWVAEKITSESMRNELT